MSSRRSPDTIALEVLDCVESKVEARKWDIVKVLGNDVQFKNWIDEFFLPEGLLVERRDGRNYFYSITEIGETFHMFLKKGNLIKVYNRISGKRLK